MNCPIYKKGDTKDCNNLIALLNVTYKIFTNCILSRIKETAENVIGDYQGGFRPGRSTTDLIFIVRQLIQKTWEFNKEMHILFVDFQKAYDSIHREGLIITLAELNFPHKLINLIKSSIMETYFRVRIGNIKSEQVQVRTGLRQGDSLSPILFNIALEKVIREMNMGQHEGVNLQDHTIGLLAYADDLVLITESQNELKSLFRRLEKSSAKKRFTYQ